MALKPKFNSSLCIENILQTRESASIGPKHTEELTFWSRCPFQGRSFNNTIFFSFKSTGGVTRDPFDLFDISTGPQIERDGDQKFDIPAETVLFD
jgi:hypothetical protein